MKLSEQKTEELMARLIRKEFDDLEYEPQYFEKHLELIKTAIELDLKDLVNEMTLDLSFESGMTERYILEKINQLN